MNDARRKKILLFAFALLWLWFGMQDAKAKDSLEIRSESITAERIQPITIPADSFATDRPPTHRLPTDGLPTTQLHIVTPPFERSAKTHEVYYLQLLRLALEKNVATDGPFIIEQHSKNLSHKRFLAELAREDGAIDIIWTMNDKRREQELLPIKVSLLRGLNSYRIFLIRKEDQHIFSSVTTFQELSKLSAGSSINWPDTPILESNGLPVVTAAHYELLFTMLAAKRFDYFPRGLYEIWNEQQIHADKNFSIESSIMLHYHAPIYFFVNKNNKALADRIERGLLLAIKDGSFDQLFFSIPGFKKGFDEMHNSSRRIFNLTTTSNTED
ncbi:MAG: hypothetical protein V4732_10805 [Pseudomonadota bacterium]